MFETGAADVLLTGALKCTRAVAAAQQQQTAALAELWSLRVQEDLAAGRTTNTGEFAVAEMAVALCSSRGAVGDLLGVGLVLADRLSAVRRAWAAGELDLARVRVIIEHTQDVSPENLDLVERLLLDRGRTAPAARLGAIIDRIVTRVEPAAVYRRAEAATKERRVCVSPAPDGMAEVWGRVDALDGRILDERLDAMARSVCSEDPRTHSARRADSLAALAAGTELICRCGCDRAGDAAAAPKVQLVITSSSLFDSSDEPAHLVGYGAVHPSTVTEHLDDAEWVEGVTDPASGALVGLGPFGSPQTEGLDDHPYRYAIGAALARLIRLRDAQCRFPGCGVPARRCDVDHRQPFDHEHPERGGPTVRENLYCLCRYHHRAKTRGVWSYDHLGGAILEWTSPTGDTYTTTAHDCGGALDAELII